MSSVYVSAATYQAHRARWDTVPTGFSLPYASCTDSRLFSYKMHLSPLKIRTILQKWHWGGVILRENILPIQEFFTFLRVKEKFYEMVTIHHSHESFAFYREKRLNDADFYELPTTGFPFPKELELKMHRVTVASKHAPIPAIANQTKNSNEALRLSTQRLRRLNPVHHRTRQHPDNPSKRFEDIVAVCTLASSTRKHSQPPYGTNQT